MHRIPQFLIGALVCAPASVAVTFITRHFWSLLEDATGIESYGHMGPAMWCYVAVYVLLLGGFMFLPLDRQ